MQIFILVTLIALGVEADDWRQYGYPHWNQRTTPPQSQAFRENLFRNVYHQNEFFGYPQQNINIDYSVANAEWICRNPNTGDLLIIASQTKDQRENQMTKPSDQSFPDPVQEQHQGQENTDSHNARTIIEDVTKPNDVKNHGGEGLIDVRLGV